MARGSRLGVGLGLGLGAPAAVIAFAAALVAALVAAPRQAEAAIVERIVAIVGERPILLSELRHRARPFLYRIAATTQNPTQQAAQESEMLRELLNKMIDERLEETAADKAHLTVTPEDVDNGIRQVAAQAKLSPKDLVSEAKKSGLSEQDYRDEIRRQLLEGKLIQLRVRGRVRVTDQDARAAYGHWAREVEQQAPVDLRILVLQVPATASRETLAARQVLADELSRRARSGEDFCELVTQYSEDPSTKVTCGSRGAVPKSALFPELQQVASSLRVGETSQPVTFRDPSGNQALLVVQLAQSQQKLPPYEQVREQAQERAFLEASERQRKQWLQELRRGVYIDVRL